ncbi:MAG: T9SS type A sorting domain-containing protein [Lentimicrobium sp.]
MTSTWGANPLLILITFVIKEITKPMYRIVLTILINALWLPLCFGQHQNILISTLRDPNEPSIIINPKDPDLIMAGANLDNYYFSDNGGYTWSESRLFSTSLGVWGDPCLVVDTMGNYYFFHLSNPPGPAWIDRIVCQKSTDNGATWNQGTGIGLNADKEQDKEWAVVDEKTNRIYVTWTQFDKYGSFDPADSTTILFSGSDDLGETWTDPVRINQIAGDCYDSDNTVEGAVPAMGPDGEIYVAWAGPSGIMFDRSTDGGVTWLDDDIFVTENPGGWDYSIPDISRANGLPVTCCDLSNGPHRGTIYINWSDQRNGSNDTDIWLVRSVDGGNTWCEPIRVNDDPAGKQQFFCWMTIDQVTGKLWFVFYDRRNHDDSMTDVYMAVSENGGDSFTNFKVSESPFYPVEDIFFGDYTNVSACNNVVRPIWTRLHNNELSIYTAMVDPLVTGLNEISPEIMTDFQTYPNPFKHSISFSFKLTSESIVNLELYNTLGQRVAIPVDSELLPSGKYVKTIDAHAGNLQPGIYYFKLRIGYNQLWKKVIFTP